MKTKLATLRDFAVYLVSHGGKSEWVTVERTDVEVFLGDRCGNRAETLVILEKFFRWAPGYPSPVSPSEAIVRLEAATATRHHEFWPCSVNLLDESRIDRTRVHGARQIPDVYPLALAVECGGRFVTFDKTIPLSAVPGLPGSISPSSEARRSVVFT